MSKRISLSLEREDEEVIKTFASRSSPEHAALLAWAQQHGLDPSRVTSEASLLRVLLRVGSEGLRERVLDDGYAELARSISEHDRGETREARSRYVKRTERKMSRA